MEIFLGNTQGISDLHRKQQKLIKLKFGNIIS